MPKLTWTAGVLLTLLVPGGADGLAAQSRATPFPAWHTELPTESTPRPSANSTDHLPGVMVKAETHSHTLTGLLIGGLVGGAATGIFLAAFCSDPDTQCGADEVGRAVVIIAVPPAIVGAVIGSLIRTRN